ncbi:MAG: tRNA (adenosine(37)-N6)-threonylcarbamoyltransferase complex dimerization subunit type 1 TsaB [bacterium]
MILLAIDTSSQAASAALFGEKGLMAEIRLNNNSRHSRTVLDLIDKTVSAAGIEKAEITGLACSRGPGSFTGLKVGMAVIKGLRAALNCPAVTVSQLEALAYPLRMSERLIVPVVEAGRGMVYAAKYRAVSGKLTLLEKQAVYEPSTLMEALDSPALVCGSGLKLCRDFLEKSPAPVVAAGSFYDLPRAGVLAELAWGSFKENSPEETDPLVPDYLMEPAAIVKPQRPC